ncbi:MAG: DUF4965 domain-containing protein [Dysgonamonadaceae bacterium]|jgi:hypothetical protein|nr:DUF4965 domain-containing protein [Dysgonamonadaceae bacterium]
MKSLRNLFFYIICTVNLCACNSEKPVSYPAVKNDLRAPAYPLVTIDPYTSAWSFSDNLYDSQIKHWTGKDLPLLGVIKVDGVDYIFMGTEEVSQELLVPTSELQAWEAKYTTSKPGDNWMKQDFDDKAWRKGKGAFGTISKYRESAARTDWMDEYIWVRREVNVEQDMTGRNIYLAYSNDDDAEFYINGEKVANVQCCNKEAQIKLSGEIAGKLKPGKNLIAACCHNPVANGLLDFGLFVEKENTKRFTQTAQQTSVDVQATQTRYVFKCGSVDLKLTFTAPLLMDNLDLLSRPVNYISYEINANDNSEHKVELLFEASPRWALNTPSQPFISEKFEKDGLLFVKTGSEEQAILGKKGDDLRIDWGYFYMAAEKGWNYSSDANLTLNRQFDVIKNVSGKIMLGYDDIYSIQYFGDNLRPYWNRDENETIFSQFKKANDEYAQIISKCNRFDDELMKNAIELGGKKYAELCALAYRQSVAAHKLVKAPNGDLLWMSKENFSNGSIGTVDITYPSAPLYLYYNPELAKGLLNHIFYYSESGRWNKPFPSHDVGTYPLANGQTYGGDMPVEESGNMLIIAAAITKIEGNVNYVEKHWDVLTLWADYLVEKGLDPENQLCTDDFAGHFAHNTNLSIKAILGIASFGYMADVAGKKDIAAQYMEKAREMAHKWVIMADDGNHYKLTFDKPDTWSQKYNLVWDKLLKFNIFPAEVAQTEIAYYLTKQNIYGLPLDSRETYTKTDWIMWTATLASDKATFERFIDPLYLFMNETTDRIPMSDWVFTDKPEHRGFRARSVVGGYYIKLLEEKLNSGK